MLRASSTHPVRVLQELPATAWGTPEASSMRWIMSTTVVFPFVPVTAATRASSPSSSRPSPTSEMMGTPRASAAREYGITGADAWARYHPVHAIEDLGAGAEDAGNV